MEWYTLDDSLRRDVIIEDFQSFIWTERYWTWGDFQIVTSSTHKNRSLLKTGTMLGMKESNRVMIVESVNDTIDTDGKQFLTVTGRSFEKILDDRIAVDLIAGLDQITPWSIQGTPAYIANYLFDIICVQFHLSPNDLIPFYTPGNLLPAGTIPPVPDVVTLEIDPGSLYTAIQQICETYWLGFRFVKDGDSGDIYFDIYTGFDCTTAQSVRPAVIFSLDLESIDKTTTLESIAGFKNVAYVFGKNDATVVLADGWTGAISGFDRKILYVDASNLDDPAGATLTRKLTNRGKRELRKYRSIYAVDGEVSQYQDYIYDQDYRLGDMVETRNPDGFAGYMIVIEQIFISDSEGDRSYPTLVQSSVAVPGSWAARIPTEHWGDVDIAQHWGET
jgi:Siphovirus ReqiPepy6 Gp37-like protein